jgi:hypothetical protein
MNQRFKERLSPSQFASLREMAADVGSVVPRESSLETITPEAVRAELRQRIKRDARRRCSVRGPFIAG